MKYNTTRKAIINGYHNIIQAGYCELQNLLTYHSPASYTCGVYGWNFDLYDIDGVAICTGYRNMPGKRVPNLVRKFDNAAMSVHGTYEERRDATEKLLREFIEKALEA